MKVTMKDFYLEAITEVNALEQSIKELDKKTIRDEFKIGTTNFATYHISDSQIIFAMSMLLSRHKGAKLMTRLRPGIEEQTRLDIEEFKVSLEHHDNLAKMRSELSDMRALKIEAKKELNDEERREIFLKKNEGVFSKKEQ